MALKSRLFRGDPKLEAAATSNSAHITSGAAGEHVRKIQYAVARLEGIPLAQDGIYGPQTANAVLGYKKKRNIINRSYQSQADDIVGILTIQSLDLEMFEAEQAPNYMKGVQCTIARQGDTESPSMR
jgi:peptidoglycan hydrolase-like protein with peptidoglycan-binding domain